MTNAKKLKKLLLKLTTIIFLLMNVIAFFHAYKLTHFSITQTERTRDPSKLSNTQKISALLFGVSNPRPVNEQIPSIAFETIILQGSKKIECWNIPVEYPKGTVILFHGFCGKKSSMLDKATVFRTQGYNTLLVDFMGSGGSEGMQTTIGYKEAEQVKKCFDYLNEKGEKNIYLFGTSMGAVAIMKAISDHNIQPKGIILECPFGSMYQTVCARFKIIKAPAFPMAGLLVFWGGFQNGFWAFGHNPTHYAKSIKCPTLLMIGGQDEKVSREEINEIFVNLKGPKTFKIYATAGHENYLTKYKDAWSQDIAAFMEQK